MGWLLLGLLWFWALGAFTPTPKTPPPNPGQQTMLDSLEAVLNQHLKPMPQDTGYTNYPGRQNTRPTYRAPQTFAFDPNTADSLTLLQLGFSPGLARSILNYRRAGGRFQTKADLAKIYYLPTRLYKRLAPYISLPDSAPPASTTPVAYTAPLPLTAFNVNTAPATTWRQIKGIGPVLAARILHYRQALGGFVRLEQLKEVYRLPDSVYQQIQAHGYISQSFAPQPLALNAWPIDSLVQHPYIRYNLARALVNYRTQHGPYQNSADLLQLHLIDSTWLYKMAPYLGPLAPTPGP